MIISLIKLQYQKLDEVIDINFYPTEKLKYQNVHRPIGLGIQGLADVF